MASWSAKELMQRHAEAEEHRGRAIHWIDECMAYAMPWRSRRHRTRQVFDHLFDSTSLSSTQRFASRIQRDMTPPFQRWFKLEAGPMVPEAQRDAVNRMLEPATEITLAAIDASAFAKASHEAYSDLAIGTGALLITEGDDRDPIKFQSAPPWELAIEEGASGRVDNVYWMRDYPAWTLPKNWPDAVWPKAVQELIDKRERKPVKILQASYLDTDERKWRIAIVCMASGSDNGAEIVWERQRRANPWVVFRWWTTAGSPWGIGPLAISMPDIKTGNKTVEMILRAAAYSLAPPLQVLHDGVVNPDQMRLAPSAIIKVARTGGPNGRSIEPLDIGSKVDLAQIVLQDVRQTVQRNLLDQQLPPDTGPVRSASEIVQRTKDLQYDGGAAFGRMQHEYAPGVIAAVVDVLDLKKVAGVKWDDIHPDGLVLKVNIISPLARAQNLDDTQNTVQWAETLKALGGDEMLAHGAVVEDFADYLAGEMGVTRKLVRTKAARAAIEKAAGAAMAAQANANNPQQPGAQPGAPSLSGGAQPAPFQTAPANLALAAPGIPANQ